MHITYLDWAATTPPDKEILSQMVDVEYKFFANPSSPHFAGQEARRILEDARKQCAYTLKCKPDNILFTSGGTESNNMVLYSVLQSTGKSSIAVSGIEHASVYESAQSLERLGITARFVNADTTGCISLEKLKESIDPNTRLVSIMSVNNETGVIQPLREIAAVIREAESRFGRRIHFHTDAVQALGKIPFYPAEVDIDSASFSGHKICGPKGIGMLYLRRPVNFLYKGGGQEQGLRPGTENLPGVWGMARAVGKYVSNLDEDLQKVREQMGKLRERLTHIRGCRFIIQNNEKNCSPYIFSAAFPPIPGEVLVRVLSDRGFAVSTGSACSTGKKNRTRVLENMGVDRKTAFSAIRISIGCTTTEEEIFKFCNTLEQEVTLLLNTL
ncbi:MAG: cysteine desulfurase family protein [Spirochaetota bacterium]